MPVIAVAVVTIMIVMIVAMVVTTAIGATLGLKRCLDFFKFGPKTMQHLFDHMVAPDAEGVSANLGGEMAISKMPRQSHQLMGVFVSDFD